MDWSSIFNSTWVTNFWTEFNAVIGSWIGIQSADMYGTPTLGVLVPVFIFLIALAVVGRMLLMIRQITDHAGAVDTGDDGSSDGGYRDA